MPAHETRVGTAEIQGRMKAEGLEALRQSSGHAPQISQFHPAEQFSLRCFAQQQADAAAIGVFLCKAVRDLGDHLGRRDTDRHRNPGPLLHRSPQVARVGFKARVESGEVQERFVDRSRSVVGQFGETRTETAYLIAMVVGS
jgi:hypothetical protein